MPEPEPQATARYRALSAAGSLPGEHLSAQLTALAAAEVLIEGLKRVGRDLGRESFVETLEGLIRFSTGYGPAISYGAGRRLGARGETLEALSAQFESLLGRLQTPAAKKGLEKAFNATSAALGKAAVEATRRRGGGGSVTS